MTAFDRSMIAARQALQCALDAASGLRGTARDDARDVAYIEYEAAKYAAEYAQDCAAGQY